MDNFWQDKNFARREDRRHRRAMLVGWIVVAIIGLYLAVTGIVSMTNAPHAPVDDQGAPLYYDAPPGGLR
jgi:hypothetical protein